MKEIFLLKLGEIVLKGANKRQFENKLRQNVRRRMKKYGSELLGLETGDPRNFKSFEEFYEAYKKQHYNMLRVAFIQQYIINKLRAEHFAQPMGSAMHDLCMKYCIDLHQEQIPEGINLGYFEFMGLGTVVDSLCAVKQLVFEEKKLTMDQLIKACDLLAAFLEANNSIRSGISSPRLFAACERLRDEMTDRKRFPAELHIDSLLADFD